MAIFYRRQVDLHKRFMVFATMVLLGPAIGRIAEIMDKPPESTALAFIILPLLPLANDLIRRRKAHYASIVGGVLVFLTIPIILGLSGSDAWARFLSDTLGS